MRRAFTLVDLLVVLTIVLILIGLLVPAINATRNAAINKSNVPPPPPFNTLTAVEHMDVKTPWPGGLSGHQDFGISIVNVRGKEWIVFYNGHGIYATPTPEPR